MKGCNISSCEDSDKTARVQPTLIQLEYLWFCSYKIDVFSVTEIFVLQRSPF